MTDTYSSSVSIDIQASSGTVWHTLVTPELAAKYFFGARVVSDWKVGGRITFSGEYNGNKYEEKGTLQSVKPNIQLQYTHWSNMEGIPDLPENYRLWTFDLSETDGHTTLSVSEDNIPTESQRKRSDEFWLGVLLTIREIAEGMTTG